LVVYEFSHDQTALRIYTIECTRDVCSAVSFNLASFTPLLLDFQLKFVT